MRIGIQSWHTRTLKPSHSFCANVGRKVNVLFVQARGLHSVSLLTASLAPSYLSCRAPGIVAMATVTKQQGSDLFDKNLFNQDIQVPALRVPKQHCNVLMKQLAKFTLDKPKLRCIVHDGSNESTRLLLLSERLNSSELPDEVKEVVQKEGFEVTEYAVKLDYAHFNAEQVLKKLLPAGVDAPSSFETVGHIVHLNLRPDQLPYKHMIGQVLLDKNPHVKTVVNKLGSIENEYRVFDQELLAGEHRMETEVVQHGLKFRLDFSRVYWNSRLETEHKRLVDKYFKVEDVVVDIMAGIGPFAVPAAAKGCKVYANDLNPDSAKYMAVNVKLNRVANKVDVFKMDGRAFVKLICATPGHEQYLAQADSNNNEATEVAKPATAPQEQQQAISNSNNSKQQKGGKGNKGKGGGGNAGPLIPVDVPPVPAGFTVPQGGVIFQHAVMNLPASAVEFLDAFNGSFDPETWKYQQLPLVHVYTFKTAVETESDIIAKVEKYLGGPLEEPATIHMVRDVAPNKLMLCVTFRVPKGVAFNGRQGSQPASPADQGAAKRQKTE